MNERLADAASTLAYLWTQGHKSAMDRIGIERLIIAYPHAIQCALCALMLRNMECADARRAFENWLYDMADAAGA